MALADDKGASALWEAYKRTSDPALREQLILNYAPLVKYVAGRLAIGLPATVDFDDLVSYGIFGLVDAVERFDLSRGVKFETYALARIRGAMIDGLRANDWVPRSVRQKAKELERAVAALEARLGRSATDEEICQAINLAPGEYAQMLAEVRGATLTSLDEVWNTDADEEGKLRFMELVEDAATEDPTASVEYQEVKAMLGEAIEALPERERLVIALYYYEGLTLKEIGRVLDVSESRVCQIHTKALLRLRGRLQRFKSSLVS